jgi:predicted alpha-1,6-mannanase (GH76 family)
MKPFRFKTVVFLSLVLLFNSGICLSQTAGITSGAIYAIASKAGGKLLDVANSSMANGGNVDTWTDTKSDAERWVVASVDNNLYTLTNVGSGNLLHIASATPANSVNVNQNSNTNNNTVKWSIVDVGGGYYQLTTAANTNFALTLLNGTDSNGANVALWTTSTDSTQQWLFQMQTAQDAAPTAAIADSMFSSWKAVNYYKNTAGGQVRNEGFWVTAEIMEIVDDAYEVTGLAKYKDMFTEMYNGFIGSHGTNWMGNSYNDDISWIVLACVRAGLLMGNQTYIAKAKDHWDKMFARAWTPDFGGGLLWNQGLTTKNSCVNGPATVAAMYLGQATGDTSYYAKAIQIYTWSKIYLFTRSSGKVIDAYDSTSMNTASTTYNQGTYLGSAVMLYNYTKDTTYLNDAVKIADYTKNTMYRSGVINAEQGPDLDGFKGIFMRYARRYVTDLNKTDYIPWLQLNAKVAYNNRNSSNLTNTLWGTRTADTLLDAFAASTAVSLMINCPWSGTPVKGAYTPIGAEHADCFKVVRTTRTMLQIYLGNTPIDKLCISTVQGRVLYQSSQKVSGTININSVVFPKGIYLIIADVNNIIIAKKFIVK